MALIRYCAEVRLLLIRKGNLTTMISLSNSRSSSGGRVSSCAIYPEDPPFFPAFNNTSATITEGPLNRQVKHSLFTQLRAYGELMRPANIVTAFADILAGF